MNRVLKLKQTEKKKICAWCKHEILSCDYGGYFMGKDLICGGCYHNATAPSYYVCAGEYWEM